MIAPARRAAALGTLAAAVLAALALAWAGAAVREWLTLALASLLAMAAFLPAWDGPRSCAPEIARSLAELRDRVSVSVAGAQENRALAERIRRDKEEFLAAVSHELRTPLNAIQGFAQVLRSELDGPLSASQREDVEAIAKAGAYLKELVDEVIDASSRRTPAVARLEAIDVGELVRDVARMIEPQRRDKAIRIEVAIDPSLPRVPGDPRRIKQILINLGSNAVKFTTAGTVRFAARLEGHALRISVEDPGPGIAAGDRGRIFRAYERVDTNRGRTEGWGLGLAIALEMAQWHGGTIELESALGRGSTFTLVLPLGRDSRELRR